uniref:Uncharacterized protein n=1 Tax=Leersia perrieri TaxID=77586 RepID=A0A0D9XZ81_9ORYZ
MVPGWVLVLVLQQLVVVAELFAVVGHVMVLVSVVAEPFGVVGHVMVLETNLLALVQELVTVLVVRLLEVAVELFAVVVPVTVLEQVRVLVVVPDSFEVVEAIPFVVVGHVMVLE